MIARCGNYRAMVRGRHHATSSTAAADDLTEPESGDEAALPVLTGGVDGDRAAEHQNQGHGRVRDQPAGGRGDPTAAALLAFTPNPALAGEPVEP